MSTTTPFATGSPIEGLQIRINPKNKFLIFELHYSADPRKRDPNYRDSLKSSMPMANYLQEYELQWDTFIGTPVYRDFQRGRHVSKDPLSAEIGLPLLMGFDFGLTPACIVAQLQGEQMIVLHEFQEFNMGTRRFASKVIPQLRQLFPSHPDLKKDWLTFADPAGQNRAESDEQTSYNVLSSEFNLNVRPGAIAWEARRQSVEHFLIQHTRTGPGLLIDPSCTHFIRGMEGGYRYPEKVATIEPSKIRPIKDEFSHIQDAFQMICSSFIRPKGSSMPKIKAPNYSFSNPSGRVSGPDTRIRERSKSWPNLR
jgi:hypothetical protein